MSTPHGIKRTVNAKRGSAHFDYVLNAALRKQKVPLAHLPLQRAAWSSRVLTMARWKAMQKGIKPRLLKAAKLLLTTHSHSSFCAAGAVASGYPLLFRIRNGLIHYTCKM